MVKGSNVQIEVDTEEVPIFDGAINYAQMGLFPEGGYSNKENYEEMVIKKYDIGESIEDILYDPQTSDGLLLAVPEESASDLLIELYGLGVDKAAVIGEVKEGNKGIVLR